MNFIIRQVHCSLYSDICRTLLF